MVPSVLQPASKILAWDFEPFNDEETDSGSLFIPFSVYDTLMDLHKIDLTGLNMSATKRGNLFRMHRMMAPIG